MSTDSARLKSVATAPTVYGIETNELSNVQDCELCSVATAPTVYGIETYINASFN